MKLSPDTRAILSQIFELRAAIDPDDGSSHLMSAEIMRRGYTALYSEALADFSKIEFSETIQQEVIDILQMFREIRSAIKETNIDIADVIFPEFDDSIHEKHFAFYKFFVDRMGRFEELKFKRSSFHIDIEIYRDLHVRISEFRSENIVGLGFDRINDLCVDLDLTYIWK